MKQLSRETILLIHDRLIDRYGGSHGIRDEGMLDSALSAPYQGFGYEDFTQPLPKKRSVFVSVLSKIIPSSVETKGSEQWHC